MYGIARAIFGDNLFRLDIEALPDFVCNSVAQSPFSCDVRGQLDLLAIGERLKSGIRKIRRSSQLYVKRPSQKECSQGQSRGEPAASAKEVQSRG
jgi:hypothetical protein